MDVLSIESCVRAVVSAYSDAADLVTRIREKKQEIKSTALSEEATFKELGGSLALGPLVIQGQYDHDVRRFGEGYARGDDIAWEQMKDVLITFQLAVLSDLWGYWIEDDDDDQVALDYEALKNASDESRVNTVVCLGQLYQRMAAAQAKLAARSPMDGSMAHLMAPSLAHSKSISNHSSFSNASTATTPDPASDQMAQLRLSQSTHGTLFPARKSSTSSAASLPYDVYAVQRANSDIVERPAALFTHKSTREERQVPQIVGDSMATSPSSTTQHRLRPAVSKQTFYEDDRASHGSNGLVTASIASPRSTTSDASRCISLASNRSRSMGGTDMYEAEETVGSIRTSDEPVVNYSAMYSSPIAGNRRKHPSTRGVLDRGGQSPPHSTLEHISFLQQYSRYPVSDVAQVLYQGQQQQQQQIEPQFMTSVFDPSNRLLVGAVGSSIPITNPVRQSQPPYLKIATQAMSLVSRPTLRASPSTPLSVQSASPPVPSTSIATTTPDSSMNPSTPPLAPRPSISSFKPRPSIYHSPASVSLTLNLPTEDNLSGFCKGAFKLQVGLTKKAFGVENRPVGVYGAIAVWRCSKCTFEGRVIRMTGIPDRKGKPGKPQKTFDSRVRISKGGIRYRWVFLAKCHVRSKFSESGGIGNTDGSLGTFGCIFCCAEGAARGWGSAASPGVRGAKSTTPMFGNVASFMEHLEMHRSGVGLPSTSMQERAKCIVGRVADSGENFDINLPPL